LTLAELEAKDFEGFKGIGDKRLADLHALEVDSVLDLLMYYPRRWVDRTQECRVCDLVAGASALVVVDVLSVDKRVTRNGRSMVTVRVGDDNRQVHTHVLQPTVAQSTVVCRSHDFGVGQARHVPGRVADDEPDRRSHR